MTDDPAVNLAKYGVAYPTGQKTSPATTNNEIYLWVHPAGTSMSSTPMTGWERITAAEAKRRGLY